MIAGAMQPKTGGPPPARVLAPHVQAAMAPHYQAAMAPHRHGTAAGLSLSPAPAARHAAPRPGLPAAQPKARGSVVQQVKVYNHASKLYINDEDGQTAPPGYATVSKYFHQYQTAPGILAPGWTTNRYGGFPSIQETTVEQFDITKGGLREVGFDEWNTAVGTQGGIFTEEMGTCTSIGFTGVFNQQLYSGLYHVLDLDLQVQTIVNILGQLRAQFDGTNLPLFSNLTNVSYFAVGGHPESRQTCASILVVFRELGLPVSGVTFKTALEDADLSKMVVVDPHGNVSFASFRMEKKKQEKTLDFPGFGGFGPSGKFDLFDKPPKGGFGGGGFVTGGFTSAKSLTS